MPDHRRSRPYTTLWKSQDGAALAALTGDDPPRIVFDAHDHAFAIPLDDAINLGDALRKLSFYQWDTRLNMVETRARHLGHRVELKHDGGAVECTCGHESPDGYAHVEHLATVVSRHLQQRLDGADVVEGGDDAE